ncbi:low molecular weight phosphotyrosine protein phosphatase [Saccharophagus sp. K07]|jgi:protein-tyrosine phosphatase|uniref:low molecular weight protein-tyrosine-phosphatase n=1 Tax=Saccharophagus sp. K07 TaxID=2283636 RepID=UPI001651C613|nr:low molecular weight protein-tyrosine-phosphatase [Saccharophagus sp. K07]MBC6907184.1 low molecular weight phosphotyrosine protein phosphatase [Saccharophagus sp. K07]
MKPTHVLMVCLGNICRSPTAQGVFEHRVRQRGLEHLIVVDSAGTSGWHIGEPPDPRSSRAARTRGYDLTSQRGRQVTVADFQQFDYILAMDEQNLRALQALAPKDYPGHLGLFLDFSEQKAYREVPDPYHGGSEGFELVLDLIEDAADGLLQHILAKRPEVRAQAQKTP